MESSDLCPETEIGNLLDLLGSDEAAGRDQVRHLLTTYPSDARLHFLHGSLLAASKAYGEAHDYFAQAVALAPDYKVARYQMGLLELSSGDPVSAAATWAPLEALDADDALRLFATGLQHLARDEFAEATECLTAGLANNHENPAINRDIQLILASMETTEPPEDGATSAAHLLLQQYSMKDTKH